MSTEPHIRAATSADISAMLSLEQAAPHAAHWPVETYEEMFSAAAAPRIFLIAENAALMCGFCIARIVADAC